ncbi:MAG TPA: helix-turn-helix domain-containing protein [Pyrinomonadaceae bacterium]|nr:helix-turn-helix domain-containing protein [Pyrinomonadaceae bacterium]
MSSSLSWETSNESVSREALPRPSEPALPNLNSLREAALTVLREVETLTSRQPHREGKFELQEEVQRYEIELIKNALQRTRGNQRRAAQLLGVKVTTLNCKIKRFGISVNHDEDDWGVVV